MLLLMNYPPIVMRTALLLLLFSVLAGCVTAPPSQPHDLCNIFYEKDGWFDAAQASYERWGAPIPVQMAIIYQESSFVADAAPPRNHLFWVIPWTHVSSAYGYTQALDSTWASYVEQTGNDWANRDVFSDAIDFVGWYIDTSHDMLGISKGDAFSQYLAYHEGRAGYRNGSYRGKQWLMQTARQVDARAGRYARQLRTCRADLAADSGWFW